MNYFNPNDWITQAEAARLRGVSRQAIHKLVNKGHLNTIIIGGITFIEKSQIATYIAKEPGRPYESENNEESSHLGEILRLLRQCNESEKRTVLNYIRESINLHPIERKLNIQAEIILEALNQDASGLTFRMMRGVIAEAAFKIKYLQSSAWVDITPKGDLPYDYKLKKGNKEVSLQIKPQRSVDQKPMTANKAYRRFPDSKYVVETQKSRAGVNKKTGESTRAYFNDEFDILGVSLQPLTNDWSNFVYIPTKWLLPVEEGSNRLLKFQPVSHIRDEFWTDNFDEAVARFFSDKETVISY
jgi:hypothetical protein